MIFILIHFYFKIIPLRHHTLIHQKARKMSKLYVPEVELYYKKPIPYDDLPIVHDSNGAYKILKHNWGEQIGYIEEFNVLFLDNKARVLAFSNVAKGGYNKVHVDIRVAFATALTLRANAIILSHNHPSGELKPSRLDISLTKQFTEAGKLLNIQICDHLILTPEDGYYSFCDNSELPQAFTLMV